MGEIVNLRRAAKRRARTQKQEEAAENRRRFGRTRQERADDEAALTEAARQKSRLEDHKVAEVQPTSSSTSARDRRES